MNPRELKDAATDHFKKGRFAKAADAYLALSKAEPQEPQHLIKLGDSFRRDGRKDQAVEAYRKAVDLYARRGIVIKAIAACKLIIEIDPNRKDAQEELAKLCAKRYVRHDAQPPISLAPPKKFDKGVDEPQHVGGGLKGTSRPDWREQIHVPTPQGVSPVMQMPADGIVLDTDFSTGPADLGLQVATKHAFGVSAEDVVNEPAVAGIDLAMAENTGEREVIEVASIAVRRPATAMSNILAHASHHEDPDSVPAPHQPTPSLPSLIPPSPRAGKPEPLEPTGVPITMADVDQSSVPLFSELPREAFLDLLEQLTFKRVTAGEVILKEGDVGKSIFVLASGKAEVVKANARGEPIKLAELADGAFFGEMALLNGLPRVASVIALEDSEVLEMTEGVLRTLTAKHPSVGQSLKKFYRQRLLQNVMAISPLFRGFDKANRRMLVEKFKLRELKAGEEILTEGKVADGLYVVMHGAALVQKTDPKTGRVVPLAVLKEGDVFGEMSLLAHKPASATVVTKRRTLILRLPKPAFDELMFTHPAVLEVVSELSDQRTRVNEQILSGAIDVPREALAFL